MTKKHDHLPSNRTAELKKKLAEATRELEIEAALERVRSKAMSMRNSGDLLAAASTVFIELQNLGINQIRSGVGLIAKDFHNAKVYSATSSKGAIDLSLMGEVTLNGHPVFEQQYQSWLKRENYFVALEGKELASYYKILSGGLSAYQGFAVKKNQKEYGHWFMFSEGFLYAWSDKEYTDAEIKILERFKNLIELTVRRYIELQTAEEQAREARIEAALERVRSRTMGMQHTEELREVIQVIYGQLVHLGFEINNSGILTDFRETDDFNLWMADPYTTFLTRITIPYIDHPQMNCFKEGKAKGLDFLTYSLTFEEKNKWFEYCLPILGVAKEAQHIVFDSSGLATSAALLKNVSLYLNNFSGVPYSDADNAILMRFGKVFEQTYTRFKDLEQAEAQARESQIQLALERVRARTMAMYHSEELAETAHVLFEQLSELGNEPARISIGIMDQEKEEVSFWATDQVGGQIDINFTAPISEKTTISKMHAGWQAKLKSLSIELQGKELAAWVRFCREEMGIIIRDELLQKRRVHTVGYFSHGWINYTTHAPLSLETTQILERFATMFSYTYTRFLDLQKAEAQAREAEVQLALERVRARTMAMQRSNELSETAYVLYQQFASLGNKPLQITIGTIDAEKHVIEFWATDLEGHKSEKTAIGSLDEPFLLSKLYAAWKSKKKSAMFALSGRELKGWVKYREQISGLTGPELQGTRYVYFGYFSKGAISISSEESLSEETVQILERFAQVFDGTYTRFLDLKKAEAQARESQIETALERVRSKTMAMHNSGDVGDTVAAMLDELVKLGLEKSVRCGICIFDKTDIMEIWTAKLSKNEKADLVIGHLDKTIHPMLMGAYDAWKNKEQTFFYELAGDNLVRYTETINSYAGYPVQYDIGSLPSKKFHYNFFFADGAVYAYTNELLSNETSLICNRFAAVFGQTYRRFLDLQKAEAQAREAQIELSLERLRAKTMAMHTSEHVGETVATMFDELVKLGIDSTARTGISIIGDNREMELWRASYNPKAEVEMLVGRVDMTIHPSLKDVYEAWKNKQVFYSYELTGEDQENYFRALNDSPDYAAQFDLTALPAKQTNSVFFFPEGCVYVFTINPLSEDEARLFKRFAGVFGLTYRRYLDLQKAENQVREAKIEASLERLRAKTMAMHTSEHVGETVATMFDELVKLGIDELVDLGIEKTARCGILIIDETKHMEVWTAAYNAVGEVTLLVGRIDMMIHPMTQRLHQAWKDKLQTQTYELLGEDLKNYYRAINNSPDYPVQFDIDALPPQQFNNAFFFPEGAIFVFSLKPLPGQAAQIFKRFAGVFGLTYRRYLDLQKAENQAKEAQIQLALERVRARTMAMQKSDELAETATVLFQQLLNLGISSERTFIGMPNDETRKIELWGTEQGGYQMSMRFEYEADATYAFREIYKAWQEKRSELTVVLKGKNLDEHVNYVRDVLHMPLSVELVQKQRILYNAFFSKGLLMIVTPDTQSKETLEILERFAAVFDGTYTRFLDLQKSETQGRESQIQLALERVRARTMAMQKSDELAEVIQLIYDQLCQLNFNIDNANFVVNYKESDDLDLWLAVSGQQYSTKIHIPYLDHPIFNRLNEAKVKGLSFFSDSLTFEEKNTFFRHLFENAPQIPQERKKAVFNGPGYARSVVFMKTIALSIQNYAAIPYSDAENAVLARFGKVFEQTYTRFNDLQLAEAQAREATIEAALERVRGRAMAMHNSEDLTSTASMVFTELKRLGIRPLRCGVGLIDKETHNTALYAATGAEGEENLELMGQVTVSGHPVLVAIYNHWIENKDYFPELHGKSLKTFYEQLQLGFKVPDLQHGKKMHGNFIPFSEGCLYVWSEEPLGVQDVKILKRFTSVIDLTFKRYMELQRSEANARDAIREASLDRVRAEIASMRTPKDLERITPLMCEELTTLGIPFIRSGVFIIDEKRELIHTYLSTPDGRALAAFDLAFDSEGIGQDVLPAWRNKQIARIHWNEEEFATYTKNLVTQGTVNPGERYVTEHPDTSLDLHFLPFLQGMLYVGNVAPLLESELSVVQSLAAAFSTAYARYEDFNRLEAAKEQVDNALTELKAAQNKLIQSEKMASLGELTAGIAHEIQNPLNFVNNFSEVNQEMIDELKEELEAGNIEDALAIAADIKQNEEKINHHGKRADAIVKGMLEHSRAGTGEKQLTNINVLADEFLKLSYHGLRAKDKSFNAEMITHFDENLPKANVVQQDIGRVLINLFNNAFYAVNQKAKKEGTAYKPTVEVSTTTKDGAIIIKVKDNGNGIPDAIKDKIMQPFFTTKPTGEGTGLGLSLSYDIVVKGHRGSINVDTKEGEFTEFTIQLPLNQ